MSDSKNALHAVLATRKILIDGNADDLTMRERVAVGADPWLAYRNWSEESVRQACWRTVVSYLPDDLQKQLVELGLAESSIGR